MISKQPRMKKALALLLTALLLLGVIPLGIVNVLAEEANVFTLKIMDTKGDAVEASVTINTIVDGIESPMLFDSTPTDYAYKTTGNSIELAKINEYLEANPSKEVTVKYSISASGYANASGKITVNKSILTSNAVQIITLNGNKQVKVNLLDDYTKIKSQNINIYEVESYDVENQKITLGEKLGSYRGCTVEEGTLIAVSFQIITEGIFFKKTKNVQISPEYKANIVNSSMEYFVFKVEDDLIIDAKYVDRVYTVKVNIDSETGEITPSTDGEIKIAAPDNKTVTVSPKTNYELEKLCVNGFGVFPAMSENEDFNKVVTSFKKIENSDNYTLNINGPAFQNYFGENTENSITATFKLKEFSISTSKIGNGGITAKSNIPNNDPNKIIAKSDLIIEATSTDAYYLKSLKVNGTEIDTVKEYKVFQYDNGIKKYCFTVEDVTSDVNVDAEFAEIENANINAYEVVNIEADHICLRNDINTPTFFVRYNTEENGKTTMKPDKIKIGDNTYSIKAFDFKCKDNIGYSGWKSVFETEGGKGIENINSVIVITDEGNAYCCSGNFNIVVDKEKPSIEIVPKIDEKVVVNTKQIVEFKLCDGSGSGINLEEISVTRSYDEIIDEKVRVTYELDKSDTYKNTYICTIEATPIDAYSGKVNYKIKVFDNVGNEPAEQSFTIHNDTLAPELISGNEAVTFKIKNDNVFAHILNKISRGRWFNEQMEVVIKAIDSGIGFDEEKSIAQIRLVDESGNLFASSSNVIDKDGKTTIVLADFESNSVFKGTVQYKLSDALGNETDWLLLTTANTGSFKEGNIIMLEAQPPVISDIKVSQVSTENGVSYTDESGRYIANGDVRFEATITDAFSGIYSYYADVNEANKVGDNELKNDTGNELYSQGINITTEGAEADENDSYIFKISGVADYSGNAADDVSTTVYKDTTAPDIVGFDFSLNKWIDINKNGNLYKAVVVTDYGFYFKEAVIVTVEAEDLKTDGELASGVKEITYYAVDIEKGVIKNETIPAVDNKISFEIPANFKGQIYAMATDNVENNINNSNMHKDYDASTLIKEGDYKGFVYPDGSIIENVDKHSKTSSITIEAPKANGTQNNVYLYKYSGEATPDDAIAYESEQLVPLYNSDPTFNVTVEDSYSGIREISYSVIEGNKTTVNTVVVDNDGKISDNSWKAEENSKDNLVYKMSKAITVSGNYNNMTLIVELTDRAGNKSYDYYIFGIDKSAPVITITYSNNDVDNQSGTGSYFKAARTATVKIQERNFNTENVKFTVTNAEGSAPNVVDKGRILTDNNSNGDKNTYEYIIEFADDGVYNFNVEYNDRATNNAKIDTKNSAAPFSFTVDKTLPTISVSYDNNDSQNVKYFKAVRTATIVIKEHNFDVNRVDISQTSTLSGSIITNPSVNWTNNGDVHTATINYNNDGDYTFDITMTDKAGNKEKTVDYGSSVAAKDFTVDTTYKNIVKISGITKGGVLGLEGGKVNSNATITIVIDDVNLDNYNIKLTRSRVLVDGISNNKDDADKNNIINDPSKQYESNVDATKFVSSSSGTANATVTVSIPEKDKDGMKNDGLYTLTVQAKDKAGNASNDGDNTITFSVNRFGSVFTFSDDLYKIITDNEGFTNKKNVSDKKIEIYEYNATSIDKEEIELIENQSDSKILTKGTNYNVTTDAKQNSNTWSKYTYNINNDNFNKDGIYTLRVASTDGAGINSQTVNYSICNATFKVDDTAPVIESVNYSDDIKETKIMNHSYASANTNELTVNFTVADTIRLQEIIVKVEGTEIKKFTFGNEDESQKIENANAFEGSFSLLESTEPQTFEIIAKDKSGNIISTSDKDEFTPGYVFYDTITVSTSGWVRFKNDAAYFWGTIAAITILVLSAVWIIIVKLKKKK